ncbi:MAG: (2Fe-2S)-binding protein [Chloroflexota bacterium]
MNTEPQLVTLNINNQTKTISVPPDTPLLYILRNDLGLKAAKYGCGLEQCGACKVIINGEAVPSCQRTVESVKGTSITTLEGIGTADNLHPLQQAFIDEQALQCGYCISGIIVAAKALLDQNPSPSDAQIREALAVHLCRCGAHPRILRAIKRATAEMQ